MTLELQADHCYRDEHYSIWHMAPDEEQGPNRFVMTTGSGLMKRVAIFNADGTAINSAVSDLITDMGIPIGVPLIPSSPVTTVVTDLPLPGDAPEIRDAKMANAANEQRFTIIPGSRYPHGRWTQLLEETFLEITKLAALKGAEYSGDEDRLANFRRNAADLGVPMEVIWRVYTAKHWDAVGQYIRDLQNGVERSRLETLASRCDDIIVYMLLFKAMLEEKEVK